MAGQKGKSKRKRNEAAPVRDNSTPLVPVQVRSTVIREPTSDGNSGGRSTNNKPGYVRTYSGKNPRVLVDEDSDASTESDSDSLPVPEDSVDVERDGVEAHLVDEMDLEDYEGSLETGDVRSTNSRRESRGYDLPRQRSPGVPPKTVTIFEDMFRFHNFWEKFEDTTDEEFRIPIWTAFKQWYNVPDDIQDAVYKLFLEQLRKCYKNLVAKMKRDALKRAKLTVPSRRLLKYPPRFLKNRLRLWKQWVKYWCSEKQLKISEINSKNRKALNGGVGTHVGGSKSGSRMLSQIIDSTGETPSISKRLKLQYGKRDSEGNLISQMVNPTAQMVLKEWEGAVRETHGPEENTDENNDTRLYLDIPIVQAKRKKGRIPGFGTTKYAYIKLGIPSKGRNMGVAGEESITNEAGRVELLKQVETLNNIVSEQKKFEEQEAKINGFTNLLN